MNIYLDIDGVLLANGGYAANFADELIQTALAKHPGSVYWLTTHVWAGENRAKQVLTPFLRPETVTLLDQIKPTIWKSNKTEGIDFSQPFLWLDDYLFPDEAVALDQHNAKGNFVPVDLNQDPDQLQKIISRL